jgi:hypothetical protein
MSTITMSTLHQNDASIPLLLIHNRSGEAIEIEPDFLLDQCYFFDAIHNANAIKSLTIKLVNEVKSMRDAQKRKDPNVAKLEKQLDQKISNILSTINLLIPTEI